MFEVRIHGRGGQGIVTMAELLATAAFCEGMQSQAFPSFGSERMGAPVAAFVRMDSKRIQVRDPVTEPDLLIVGDVTLIPHLDLFAGVQENSWVLLNSSSTPSELGLSELCARLGPGHVVCVPATELARRFTGRPMPTGALLGAVAAVVGVPSLESMCSALADRFSAGVAQKNAAAAAEGYRLVRSEVGADA
jgi:pyruvate ferredoxin oxidoreductase gamma subunit